jgi:AsmA family protein
MIGRRIVSKWKWIVGITSTLILLLAITASALLSRLDLNGLKPEIERAVLNATGRKLTLEGDIRLEISLAPTLLLSGVTFRNAPWASSPDLAKIKRFELKVKLLPLLSRRVEVRRLILVEPQIFLETDAAGKSNLVFGPEAGGGINQANDAGWKMASLTFNELQIERGLVMYRGFGSKEPLVMKVDSLTATAQNSQSPVKLKLKGDCNDMTFEVEGALCPLTAFVKPAKAWPIDLTLKSGALTLTLDGTIVDPLAVSGARLKFALRGKDLSSFGKIFGETALLPGKLEASCEITDSAPHIYSISRLHITEGETDLSGSVDLNLEGNRPAFKAVLSAQRLDLRPYLRVKKEERKVRKDRLFPADPLPLDTLRLADVDLSLRANQVLLPNQTLERVEVGMLLKEGAVIVKPLRAGLGKGSLEGYFSLQPQKQTASVTAALKADKIGVTYLAKRLEGAEALEGTVDMDIDIGGQGRSVAGVMGNLHGKVYLAMGRGKISITHVNLLGSELSSGILRLINPFGQGTEYIVIRCLVSDFNIRSGKAEATSLVVNTDQMIVVGDGYVDLRAERLNLSLKPVPRKDLGISLTSKLRIGLGELSSPLRLTGTLAHPRLALDPTQTALSLGKAIGGVLLFGPAGIAGALIGSNPGNDNSCVEAIAASKKDSRSRKQKGAGVTEGAEKLFEGAGKELEKLLGR